MDNGIRSATLPRQPERLGWSTPVGHTGWSTRARARQLGERGCPPATTVRVHQKQQECCDDTVHTIHTTHATHTPHQPTRATDERRHAHPRNTPRCHVSRRTSTARTTTGPSRPGPRLRTHIRSQGPSSRPRHTHNATETRVSAELALSTLVSPVRSRRARVHAAIGHRDRPVRRPAHRGGPCGRPHRIAHRPQAARPHPSPNQTYVPITPENTAPDPRTHTFRPSQGGSR